MALSYWLVWPNVMPLAINASELSECLLMTSVKSKIACLDMPSRRRNAAARQEGVDFTWVSFNCLGKEIGLLNQISAVFQVLHQCQIVRPRVLCSVQGSLYKFYMLFSSLFWLLSLSAFSILDFVAEQEIPLERMFSSAALRLLQLATSILFCQTDAMSCPLLNELLSKIRHVEVCL